MSAGAYTMHYSLVGGVVALLLMVLAGWQSRGAKRPQPFDGLVLFPALAGGLAVQALRPVLYAPYLAGALLAVALLFVLALIETRRGPGAGLRLAFQIAAAAVLVHMGFGMERAFIPFVHRTWDLGPAAPWVSGACIVLLMNGFSYVHTMGGSVSAAAALIAMGVALLRGIYIGPHALILPALLAGAAIGLAGHNLTRETPRTGHAGALLLGGLCAAAWMAPGMPAMTSPLFALPIVVLVLGLTEGWRTLRLRAAGSITGQRLWRKQYGFILQIGLACPMTPVLYLPARLISRAAPPAPSTGLYRSVDPDDTPATSLGFLVACALLASAAFLLARGLHAATDDAARQGAMAVRALIDEGRAEEAYAAATLAVARSPYDTTLHYAKAEAANARHGSDAARDALAALFAINRRPNPTFDPLRPERASAWLPATRPFVHIPGRLLEADLNLAADHPLAATASFTLAGSFGRKLPRKTTEKHCQALGAIGAWQRALPYCAEETGFPRRIPDDMLETACVGLAAAGEWGACQRVVERWLVREPEAREALFWSGRTRLALGDAEAAIADLRRAVVQGHSDAPWFLGMALLETSPDLAEREFLRTLQGSLFRTAGVALAVQLAERRMAAMTPDDPARTELAANIVEYHATLDRLVNQQPTVSAQFVQDRPEDRLLGMDPRPPSEGACHYAAGVLWALEGSGGENAPRMDIDFSDPQQPWVRYRNRVVEVRWVDDLAPFGDFAWSAGDEDVLPGWPEAYARVRNVNPGDAMQQARSEDGKAWLEVATKSDREVAMAVSTYIPVDPRRQYVFGVRCQSLDVRLVTGWEWYDETDASLSTANLINQFEVKNWKWRVRHLFPPEEARSIRLHAGIYEDTGVARFDRVQFFALAPRRPAATAPATE